MHLAGNMTQVDWKNIYVRNVRIIGSTAALPVAKVKAQILPAWCAMYGQGGDAP